MDPFYRMSFRLSQEQREMKQRFISAKSVTEILECFEELERCFRQSDLGLACCYVVQKLYNEENEDPTKILTFGKKALEILMRDGSNMATVGVLGLLGTSCSKLNRLEESYRYLTWAVRLLEKLDKTSSSSNDNVLRNLHAINLQLYSLDTSTGTSEGCITYMLKNLDITEKLSGKNSVELAEANWEVSMLFFREKKYQEAQQFCFEALKIYVNCSGDNSDKIAECGKQLRVLHILVGENGTVLEQNRNSQKLVNNLRYTSISVDIEMRAASMLNQSGKSEEAIEALKDIIPRTEKHGMERIYAFTYMAHFLIGQRKIADAKECAKNIRGILSVIRNNARDYGVGLMGIAGIYKELNEFETALSLLRKGLVAIEEAIEKKNPDSALKPFLAQSSKRLVPFC